MSRFNHRNKWTQRDYIVRFLSIAFVIAVFVTLMPRESVRTYHYHEGGIWGYSTLIAKDSFPILKSKASIFCRRFSTSSPRRPLARRRLSALSAI